PICTKNWHCDCGANSIAAVFGCNCLRARRSALDPALADQAFLCNRGNEGPVPSKNQPAGETAGAVQVRTVLCIEQPVVGPERPMEPQRVIEARRDERFLE